MEQNYYHILGVSTRAKPAEIKTAFERLAQLYNAGRLSEPQFNQALDAFATLRDEASRKAYDRSLPTPKPTAGWLDRFRRTPRTPAVLTAERPQPTFTQLLDFDWEALEEQPQESPRQRKAFFDELYFKAAVIAVFIAVVVLIFFALRSELGG